MEIKTLRFTIFRIDFGMLKFAVKLFPRVKNWDMWLHGLILFTINKGLCREKLFRILDKIVGWN